MTSPVPAHRPPDLALEEGEEEEEEEEEGEGRYGGA